MSKTVIAKVTCDRVYMTVAILKEYLGFANEDTQKEWRDAGVLPFYQIGRMILYKRSDVDAFVEKHRIEINQPISLSR